MVSCASWAITSVNCVARALSVMVTITRTSAASDSATDTSVLTTGAVGSLPSARRTAVT